MPTLSALRAGGAVLTSVNISPGYSPGWSNVGSVSNRSPAMLSRTVGPPRASMVRPESDPEPGWANEECVVVMGSIVVFSAIRRKRSTGLVTI